MVRNVNYYEGEQISDDVIFLAKDIISKCDNAWILSWRDIDCVEDLCSFHGSYLDEERMFLGEDWVISYVDSFDDDEIYIGQWARCESDNKFLQSVEMMMALKKILLNSNGRKISCGMRHDTSFPFYQSFLKKGFLEELSSSTEVDNYLYNSKELNRVIKSILNEYNSLDDYFSNRGYDEFPSRFHKLIFHEVSFCVTDRFVKRYKKD